MRTAVRLRGVSKRFVTNDGLRTWKDLVAGRRRRLPPVEALRDVDLDIAAGSAVGIVGANGAGKSTLLRVAAGVLAPDTGTVELGGAVGSLLELGPGFHPDLTGRESAVLAGVIGGLSRRDARSSVDDVAEFAELEDFLDRPLRTYSSGMQARLAFAIATLRRPEILLVDEVLAVGDVRFQQKCLERLCAYQAAGSTLLLVSHDPDLVRLLCERAVWLDAGEVVADGPTAEALDHYLAADGRAGAPAPIVPGRAIRATTLLDDSGNAARVVYAGSPLVVDVELAPVGGPARLAVRIVREDDLVCVDTSTELEPGDGRAVLHLDRLDLAPGAYRVDVGLYDGSWRTTLDFTHGAASLRVLGTASSTAALAPPAAWRIPRGGEGRSALQGDGTG